MPSQYDGWSRDQLEQENQRLMEAKEKIRQEQLAINAELDLAAAREKVEAMTDTERQALAQVIGPKGIDTAETVGTPGGEG